MIEPTRHSVVEKPTANADVLREDEMSVEPMGFHIGYVLVSAFEALDRSQRSGWERRLARIWRLLA